ncbi:kinase-like protein [Laetiporus sulphureus 93-53]|uniref:Kinase-like protein n=1 Tax=Laetiporus sulphureus 93-53 TaxID=1314785 RepID=A0A165CRC3_9APHY|nr:kinase-like protein [Laetiporus sulphureus 93-53]KZT03289.1 kinase-like protein [Laetiporus sulphureus 93-53]
MADKADSASHRSQSTVSSASRSSGSSVSTTAFGSGSTPSSAYTKVSPAPSPRISTTFASAENDHERVSPARLDKGKSPLPEIQLDLDIDLDLDLGVLQRPSVLIDDIIATGVLYEPSISPSQSPSTPAPRYPGWVSEVVAPLSEFIDETVDPRALYGDLREVGEGDSGSVYAARVLAPAKGKAKGSEEADANATYVAIKNVPLLPSGSPKLLDLRRELRLMRDVRHPNVLTMDEVLVDIVEDALWMKMELMERSLADILILVEGGIVVHEKPIAQFASDVLHALSYLQRLGIAHRDLRSDNLLVNSAGVVKLADFSNAVRVSPEEPLCTDAVGVIYFQAPEMRRCPYNALKVDVWSLGATVWELAQTEPPFSDITDASQAADRWPPLNQPEIYSRSFHDFLHLCSRPSLSRPDPDELLKTPFIRSASGRPAIVKLLAECRSIEERTFRRQSVGSNGTISMS